MSEMKSFRLEPGQTIVLSNTPYSFIKRRKGEKQFLNQASGQMAWVDEKELNRALGAGELRLDSHFSTPECRLRVQQMHFSDLPMETQKLAQLRMDYVRALVRNTDLGCPQKPKAVIDGVFERRRQEAFDAGQAFTEKKPGLTSTYEWRTEWNKPGRPTIMRLVFAESERGKRRLAADELTEGNRIQQIIVDAIRELHLTPQRHLVKTTFDRVVANCEADGITGGLVPCERTIRRLIQSLSPRLLLEARHGKRAADLVYKGTHRMKVPEMPGEVLEVDAHKFNLLAVGRNRNGGRAALGDRGHRSMHPHDRWLSCSRWSALVPDDCRMSP